MGKQSIETTELPTVNQIDPILYNRISHVLNVIKRWIRIITCGKCVLHTQLVFYHDSWLRAFTPDEIVRMVEDKLELPLGTIQSRTRADGAPDARHIAARLIKDSYPDLSLKKIGGYMGGRDHTTVINSLQKWRDLKDVDKRFKMKYNMCKDHLESTVRSYNIDG